MISSETPVTGEPPAKITADPTRSTSDATAPPCMRLLALFDCAGRTCAHRYTRCSVQRSYVQYSREAVSTVGTREVWLRTYRREARRDHEGAEEAPGFDGLDAEPGYGEGVVQSVAQGTVVPPLNGFVNILALAAAFELRHLQALSVSGRLHGIYKRPLSAWPPLAFFAIGTP